jgi:uncharacterized protein (DUF3820 family)
VEQKTEIPNEHLDQWSKARTRNVEFGKYRAEKWYDVPIEYLKWLASRNDRGVVRGRHRYMAQLELEYRVRR